LGNDFYFEFNPSFKLYRGREENFYDGNVIMPSVITLHTVAINCQHRFALPRCNCDDSVFIRKCHLCHALISVKEARWPMMSHTALATFSRFLAPDFRSGSNFAIRIMQGGEHRSEKGSCEGDSRAVASLLE